MSAEKSYVNTFSRSRKISMVVTIGSAFIAVAAVLSSSQGEAHLSNLFDSGAEQSTSEHNCHLLDEYSTLALNHEQVSASDLISAHSKLKSAHLRVIHPDHRDDPSVQGDLHCQQVRANIFPISTN